jgi:carboxypeptidase family protein
MRRNSRLAGYVLEQLRLCLSVLTLAACGAYPGLAQAPVGSITGSVSDTTAGVMQGVTVTVTNKETGLERQTVTSAEGIYSAASLPAGNYSVKATAEGFRTVLQSATIQAGQVTTVDLVMDIGSTTEVVRVESEAAQINFDSHSISGVITRQRIEDLPLNGRDFLQLSMLEPGVTVSPNNVGQYNKQFDLSILGAGSGNNSVRITVDGATVQDAITGGTQQNFSQEVVQEFQLSSTNMDLSTGIGAGGAVNVVTRSGGNAFHGSGFFYFRDHNMAAYPYLERAASPFFVRRQEGYWVGGPIKKERLFFFSSLEHTNQTGVFSSLPSDSRFQKFATNAPSPYHVNELTERLDWRVSTKHSAFLRYSHDGNDSYAPPGLGDLPSDWNFNTNWADSGVFSLISGLTANSANEFRYSMTYWSNSNNPPTAAQCPAPCYGLGFPMITVYGVNDFALGNASNAPQSRLVRRHIFADNLSSQKGRHSLKIGGYWEYQKGTGTYAYASPAAAELYSPEIVQQFNSQVPAPYQIAIPSSFNTMDDLLRLPVAGFQMGLGDIHQPPLWHRGAADHDHFFHLYAQDTWKIRPRLSLNYGLAWSYESNALNHDLTKPAYLTPIFGANGLGHEQHSPLNFSPMLGFAWTATKDNKTVVRGGVGIYYDTWDVFNRLIERAILGPRGTGRALLGDSVFFPAISQLNGFAALPPALQPTSLGSQPTTFTGQEMLALLPVFAARAENVLGPTGSPDLSVRNIQLFKTGFDLLPANFRLPYSEHASIGIQREVRADLVVSADFVFRQYLHQLIANTDLNRYYSAAGPIIPKCSAGQSLDLTAECSNGVMQADVSGARSHYKGLLLKADKRFSHRMTATLAYSYANQIGYNGLVDNSNWFASWGPQASHQILTGSVVVDLPWGFRFSGITSFQSTPPFQPYLAGIDLNSNGIVKSVGESVLGGMPLPGAGYNQFAINKGKDALIQAVNQFNQAYAGKTTASGQLIPTIALPSNFSFPYSFNSQDLRLSKKFRLHSEHWKAEAFGEIFNLFNIANLNDFSASLTERGFGQPAQRTPNIFGTGGPRAFQIGARLSF